jgi:hypothetical protein
MEKTAVNEARTLMDVSNDYAEAMKSFFVRFSSAIGSHRSVPCVGPIRRFSAHVPDITYLKKE